MARLKDVYLNESGDVEVGSNGDIKCCYDDDVIVEGIIFRLKTYAGDYYLEPDCGASLEDFIGEPSTYGLGEQIRGRVISALTHDGFLDEQDLSVDVAPLSETSLAVVVTTTGIRGTFTIASALDLMTGKLEVAS